MSCILTWVALSAWLGGMSMGWCWISLDVSHASSRPTQSVHLYAILSLPLPPPRSYGHPTDRPHYASGLPPAAFEAVVCSYLQHGLAGTAPKVGGWSWEELQVGAGEAGGAGRAGSMAQGRL